MMQWDDQEQQKDKANAVYRLPVLVSKSPERSHPLFGEPTSDHEIAPQIRYLCATNGTM